MLLLLLLQERDDRRFSAAVKIEKDVFSIDFREGEGFVKMGRHAINRKDPISSSSRRISHNGILVNIMNQNRNEVSQGRITWLPANGVALEHQWNAFFSFYCHTMIIKGYSPSSSSGSNSFWTAVFFLLSKCAIYSRS